MITEKDKVVSIEGMGRVKEILVRYLNKDSRYHLYITTKNGNTYNLKLPFSVERLREKFGNDIVEKFPYAIRHGNYVIAKPPRLKEYLEQAKRTIRRAKEKLESRTWLASYIDSDMVVAIMASEVISRAFMLEHQNNAELLLNALYGATAFPLNATTSNDKHRSLGAYQTLERNYKKIVDKYSKFFTAEEKNIIGCRSFMCQTRVAYLLVYDNIKRVERSVPTGKESNLRRSFNSWSNKEKRLFTAFLSYAMHNGGYSLVRRALGDVFTKPLTYDDALMEMERKLGAVGKYAIANLNLYMALENDKEFLVSSYSRNR
ncbi:MAG: hypothetical protein D6769_00500 [Methanobacteriota archaeon]|nr:MAG: hypothetical protein D6769_00500 [Euryarchaeota archaeon]